MLATTSCGRVLIFWLMIGVSSPLVAADWPQWRGPDRDARAAETGLLQQWPADGPALVWKAPGLGAGYSGVSVAGGRVFTMGGYRDDTCVIALSEKSGEQAWSVKIGGPGVRGGHPGPRCTPAVSGERVLALTQDGDLACLAAADGKVVWRKSLRDDFGGRTLNPQFGYCESPLVDSDKVICTPGGPDGAVLALDKETGRTIWRSKELTDAAGFSSAIAAEIGGVRQIIVTTESSVAGVAAADGTLLWRSPRKGGLATVPTPIHQDGMVYVTASLENGELFRIRATDGKFSVQRIYANRNILSDFGGAVLADGHLYGYSGRKGLVCQELSSGKEMWANDAFGPCSVMWADGCLYLRNPGDKKTKAPGFAGLAKATPEGYQERGRFTPPDRGNKLAYPHPVVANGNLFLRDQELLLCYDVKAK